MDYRKTRQSTLWKSLDTCSVVNISDNLSPSLSSSSSLSPIITINSVSSQPPPPLSPHHHHQRESQFPDLKGRKWQKKAANMRRSGRRKRIWRGSHERESGNGGEGAKESESGLEGSKRKGKWSRRKQKKVDKCQENNDGIIGSSWPTSCLYWVPTQVKLCLGFPKCNFFSQQNHKNHNLPI